MKTTIEFGRRGLVIEVPDRNLLTILDQRTCPAISEPRSSLKEKLFSPVGTRPFTEICSSRKRACIVVSDKTRPVPNKIVLPPLLDVLDDFKIPSTILIACGMHSPTEGKDLDAVLGNNIASRYEVVNHDAQGDRQLVHIGKSRAGIDVSINRHFVEADLKITVGFIEPHFMAGFSGGRKSVCPGIAGVETIKYAHSPAIMDSPFSSSGVIDRNPLHEFSLEVARMAGVDFIVDVTLNREKEITGVFCGDLEMAHSEGVSFCRKQSQVAIPQEAAIVVTTNGGYPLDQDFYQSVKGMVCALPAVKKGGTIIIASECSKGIGSNDFRELLFEMKSVNSFMDTINAPGFFRPDQWEVQELIKAKRKAEIKLYSTGMSKEEASKCQVGSLDSVEQGIEESLMKHGPDAKIIVIPSGPYVLPVVSNFGPEQEGLTFHSAAEFA